MHAKSPSLGQSPGALFQEAKAPVPPSDPPFWNGALLSPISPGQRGPGNRKVSSSGVRLWLSVFLWSSRSRFQHSASCLSQVTPTIVPVPFPEPPFVLTMLHSRIEAPPSAEAPPVSCGPPRSRSHVALVFSPGWVVPRNPDAGLRSWLNGPSSRPPNPVHVGFLHLLQR